MNVISGIQSITNSSLLSEILPKWDLQNVKYNGVTFVNFLPRNAINNAVNTAQSVAQLFNVKIPLLDPNRFIPKGVITALLQQKNSFAKKMTVHQLPNSDINYIYDGGLGTETFVGLGLISGQDYQKLEQNMVKACVASKSNPNGVPSSELYVFYSPDGRKIENAYLRSLDRHLGAEAQSAVFFTYKIEACSVTVPKLKEANLFQQLNSGFNLLLATINNINALVLETSILKNNITGIFGSNSKNGSSFINVTLPKITLGCLLLSTIGAILYANFTPLNYNNPYFEDRPLGFNQFPNLSFYATTNDKDGVSGLISIYINYIDAIIAEANKLNVSSNLANLMLALQTSKGSLIELAKVITINAIQQIYHYTVPADMGICQLCFYNNLDFNNLSIIKAIFEDNKSSNISFNFIPQNTKIILRKSYE